jgi:hypothetical protein
VSSFLRLFCPSTIFHFYYAKLWARLLVVFVGAAWRVPPGPLCFCNSSSSSQLKRSK